MHVDDEKGPRTSFHGRWMISNGLYEEYQDPKGVRKYNRWMTRKTKG